VLVWIGIALALIAVATLALAWGRGDLHDAGAADAPSRRELEAAGRILTPGQRARYLDSWRRVEATFADDPEAGIARADHVLRQLAAELGYRFELLQEDPRFAEAQAVAAANELRPVRPRQLQRAMRAHRERFAMLILPAARPAPPQDRRLVLRRSGSRR
jgi:hypothetical protein